MTDLNFWHKRYQEQANWTRELRQKLCRQINNPQKSKILEVGCGTGAIIAEIVQQAHPHLAVGIDLELSSVKFAANQQNKINYISGNGFVLPFPDFCFDLTFVHFVLLWVNDPARMVKEMVRVTKKGGLIAAFAEPDYRGRIDYPEEMESIGKQQTLSLIKQGVDPHCGRKLASYFHDAGINNFSAGIYGSQWKIGSQPFETTESDVLKSDLNMLSENLNTDQQTAIDQNSKNNGTRVLFVPTFFAYGAVN